VRSSAFPSLFSPVEIDGQLLVDGGVTNNYPIDAIRKLGADIIIGVDVQDDLGTELQGCYKNFSPNYEPAFDRRNEKKGPEYLY
jgi:predicted acylesterase/phospholipase RssA